MIRPGWARSSHHLGRRIISHLRPPQLSLWLSLPDLRVCLSTYRCSSLPSILSPVLQHTYIHTKHIQPLVSDLRPCLTSRPPQPPHLVSCLGPWVLFRQNKKKKREGTSSPARPPPHNLSLPLDHTFFSPRQATSSPTPCTDFICNCICICLHLHHVCIALHGITSNIHTPLSVPTLAHPPASASRPCGLSCLTTLSTAVAEPSSCPAVQRTDRRRALLRVAAAAPVPVRPSPPSVSPLAPEPPGHPSVTFCAPPSTTRLWNIQSRPSCTV